MKQQDDNKKRGNDPHSYNDITKYFVAGFVWIALRYQVE